MDKEIAEFVEKSKLYGFKTAQHDHIQWLEGVYGVWRPVIVAAGLAVEDILRTLVDICQDIHLLTQCMGIDVDWCRKQDLAFHSQFTSEVSSPSSEDRHSSEKTLGNKRCILLGRLTTASSDHPGQLVLVDSASSLPVELRHSDYNEMLGLLDQWAVFPSWNLIIKSRGQCYLELCVKPVRIRPTSNQPVLSKPLPVVSAEVASVLLLHKDTLKPGCINMVATVEALGEIHRVKTDLLFCIRLPHGVNIIVKKPEFLHWQKFLTPGEKIVLTGLRPTTLKKGAGSSIKVFVPWTDSLLLSPATLDFTCISAQEWLERQGVDPSILEEITCKGKEEEMEDETEEDPALDMASYQGILTSNELGAVGIYMLDSKVGLCVSCVPAIHKYQSLRVGSKVIVYNAHFIRSKQFPHLRVVCCTSSCIKVTEFSALNNKPKMVHLPLMLHQTLKKCCVTQEMLDTFINLTFSLHNKLCSKFYHDLPDIVETVFGRCSTDQDKAGRVYIQEFLSRTHQCGLLREQGGSEGYPVVPDMKTFIQEIRCLETQTDNLTDNDTYWGFHHQHQGQPQKILIGILDLSSKNGRVQLRDDTGFVDCVITMTTSSEDHFCTKICKCCDLESGSYFRCPFIQTCCVGAVVAVTKFTVIREQFINIDASLKNFKMTDSDTSSSNTCYVMFSMLNVVLIYRRTVSIAPKEQVPLKKGKIGQDHTGLLTDVNKGRQLVLINHRETLVLERRVHCDSHFRMAVQGYLLQNTDEKSLDWETLPNLQEQSSHQCSRQFEHCNCAEHQSGLKLELENSLSPVVILLFENNAIRWCQTIVPGGVYSILLPTGKLCPPGATSWQLKKAVAKAGGRSVHKVPGSTRLSRVFPNRIPPSAGRNSSRNLSIKAILTEKCEATLVSIEGLVVRRFPVDTNSHPTSTKGHMPSDLHSNQQLGVGSPDGCGMKIVVRCWRSGDEVDVYLNLDSFIYPLGLLPGVGVRLEQLERKVSRKNNVYCQFIAISCLHIKYHTELARAIPSHNQCLEVTSVQLVYLSDLWRSKVHGSPFPVCCHVQRFLKVSLKWVCQHCGAVCVGGACSNTACQTDYGARFLARASVIVEDGTSVAIVTMRDAAVQKLLLLSDREWSSLQSVIHTQGEMFLQKARPEYGNQVEMFVYQLCESSLVKKDWEMWLRMRTGVSTDWSVCRSLDDMTLDEFSLKNVDTGVASMETRCLPFLQLDCVDVKEIDNRKWTLLFLK